MSQKGFHDQRSIIPPTYQLTSYNKSVVPGNEQVAELIEEGEAFIPLNMEADYSTTELHPNHSVQKHSLGTDTLPLFTKAIRKKEQNQAQSLGAEIGSSLDQLWRRFNEQCSLQETRSTNDAEMSLLDRLERLSRLLHSSSPPHTPKLAHSRVEKGKSRRSEHESRRTQGKGKEKERSEVRGILKTAWQKESLSTNQTLVENEQLEKDYRCPAERDESTSVSVETSSNQSTIDTQRLIRAFGPHRVSNGREEVAGSQTLKPNDGLQKLYNTIKKQKRGRGKGSSENHLVSVATEISNTDDSTVRFNTRNISVKSILE